MSDKISIVGIQTTLTKGKKDNLDRALGIMESALKLHKHVDMVVLPENFCFFPAKGEAEYIGAIPDDFIKVFSEYAKTYNTYITAGSITNRREGRLYNTSLLFDRRGNIAGSYDKVHLFDALNAGAEDKESNMITAGDRLLIHDGDFGRIGTMICYDIRFPEMARTLALSGVQYLFVPAAFYMPRFDHWQTLIKTAALQNSMYVAGANLFGKFGNTSGFCGRSLIADPWGIALAVSSDKAGFIQAYVDGDYCNEIRDAVGSFHNRVPSVYNMPR
ncbi:carbon-nitrogen hydrolase family protein [Bacillota bacterium]